MRLRLRVLWLLIASLWRARRELLDESVLTLRVLPNDVDVSKMTDDRYFAIMGLGRLDLALRVKGVVRMMRRRGWGHVATFGTVRFRHPLSLFQKFTLRSRFVYWDEDTFYVRQSFEHEGRTVATGYGCLTFLGSAGHVSPLEALAELGLNVRRPDEPEVVSQLQELRRMIHEEQGDRGAALDEPRRVQASG